MRKRWIAGGLAGAVTLAAALCFDRWIATAPVPPLAPAVSTVALDRDGALLRAWPEPGGRWRLPVAAADVDPRYLAMLQAYEDKRFERHGGVDAIAMLRALALAAWHGRVVSGGSTLTMQVARLLDRSPAGRWETKLRQMRLALALERRLSKTEILELYLTLAPFGGNIEGVRAASLSWFGKEPRRLTAAEAALLVALPQSPEARRPDRNPERARAARDRILMRVAQAGAIPSEEAEAGTREASPKARRAFPLLAPHLTERMRRKRPGVRAHRLTVDADLQRRLERLVKARLVAMAPALSAAVIVADHGTGEILASIGSPDLFDARRRGYVDMTRAIRSPGSTLKPLVYGLAFEQGLAHPETLIADRPTDFGGYAPRNFGGGFRGTVTARQALQLSLNVPAVALLEAVGPARLTARMRRAGAAPRLPRGGAPSLAMALGGVGMTLHDLTALYAAIAGGGAPVALHARRDEAPSPAAAPVLSPEAAWHVADILAGAPPPDSAAKDRLAFKTGTSYGHRDAWAAGFDGRHIIAVWIGRPDGAPATGVLGLDTAAPLLFEAFGRLKPVPDPLRPAPASTLTMTNADLPAPLQRFRRPGGADARNDGPRIAFPPDGAQVELGGLDGLALKVRGGAPPFTWLADGRPIGAASRQRDALYSPEGPGFLNLSVIDAEGEAASARVRLR